MSLAAFGTWWTATIFPWAIESTLVGLVLLAILRLGAHTQPAFRKAVATIALAKMALPPQLLPVGLLSLGVTDPSRNLTAPLGAPLAGAAMGVVGIVHLLGVALGVALLARHAVQLVRLRASATPAGAGSTQQLAKELAQELGMRRPPRVVESELVDVPFASGLIEPTVALPSGLVGRSGPGQLRALLAHELAHLRRGDVWLSWLRAAVVTLWWPSPLVRALAREQERATEELCDDIVLGRGFATARDYASGLLNVATAALPRRRGLVASALGTDQLASRILRFSSPARSRLAWTSVLALLILTVLLLPPSATGRVSPAGWTTAIFFAHDTPASAAHQPAADLRHQHNH